MLYFVLNRVILMDLMGLSRKCFGSMWISLTTTPSSWFWRAYQALRTRYGNELDAELLHDNPTWDFRNSFCQSVSLYHA